MPLALIDAHDQCPRMVACQAQYRRAVARPRGRRRSARLGYEAEELADVELTDMTAHDAAHEHE